MHILIHMHVWMHVSCMWEQRQTHHSQVRQKSWKPRWHNQKQTCSFWVSSEDQNLQLFSALHCRPPWLLPNSDLKDKDRETERKKTMLSAQNRREIHIYIQSYMSMNIYYFVQIQIQAAAMKMEMQSFGSLYRQNADVTRLGQKCPSHVP